MRKFNQVYKEKQAISEQVLEERLLNQFKDIYAGLLEQYEITEFHDLDENTQVAFLRELNEYWTEEEGLSEKGANFLKTKSTLLTEDSTPLQKQSYLRNKAAAVIEETLRQAGLKDKLYAVLDEMFKNTKSDNIEDVLSTYAITGTILEAFGVSLQELMTEMVYELTPEVEVLNEAELSRELHPKVIAFLNKNPNYKKIKGKEWGEWLEAEQWITLSRKLDQIKASGEKLIKDDISSVIGTKYAPVFWDFLVKNNSK